ncbi:MAG: hypothetical protein NTY66_04660 [Candidatus Vogelbacteria bacterium]|nr:hypothetical protein [Candidatus Vogelbacteria bacterium]
MTPNAVLEQSTRQDEATIKRTVVEWNRPEHDGEGMGSQSRPMTGAAESGCCRQGGSPCSSKKFS